MKEDSILYNVFEMSNVIASDLELDPLSALTMAYTVDGLEELKNDILNKGQLVPIILREGRILDGRHRNICCEHLGISRLCKEVGNVSDEEAVDIVVSNSLNKSTSTDAAKVEAYLMCKAKGIRKVDMPKKFNRLNTNYVKKLVYIEKSNPEYLTAFLNQNSITLYNKEFNKVEDYGTINGLWRTLKGNQKLETKVIEVVAGPVQTQEYSTNIEEYFSNPSAEDEYWELFNLGKTSGTNLHPATELGSRIAALVKSKHSQ